jgi:hypothetical protein
MPLEPAAAAETASNPGAATRVTRSLRPGQPGTLKLMRLYGRGLLCVRYREDARGQTRYTTVEIVVDQSPVARRLTDRSILWVRIAWGEAELASRAKAMGARWDPAVRLWKMSYKAVKALDLHSRVHPKLSIDAHSR